MALPSAYQTRSMLDVLRPGCRMAVWKDKGKKFVKTDGIYQRVEFCLFKMV